MEKFKIVSNETGESATLYIDGKEVKRVTDIIIQTNPAGHGIDLTLKRYMTDDTHDYFFNDDRTDFLWDIQHYQFCPVDFSKYMNPPEDS